MAESAAPIIGATMDPVAVAIVMPLIVAGFLYACVCLWRNRG
jgi:hypothetical protein